MNIKYPSYYPASDSGGSSASESENEQDLSQLSDEGEANDSSEEGEQGDSGREDEDRSPSRRARGAAEEDSEDSSSEEDEDSDSDNEPKDKLDDLDDEEEGQEETQETYTRPPVKLVKQKYPNFFKDFPQLKAAFFGYPQFTEIFADVDSAREAASKAQEYDILESTLVGKGDAKPLLESLSENNPKALKKMVASFADNLRKVDQDVYIQLANPIIEELLYHASAHGVKVGNKNLQLAARHLANFVFANGGEIPDISKRTDKAEPSDAERQLVEERESYAKEKFQSALGDVVELIKPDMNSLLSNKLEGLTGFERKQILKEAKGEIDRILLNDKAFQSNLRALWKKAETTGYSNESKSRIKRAWLDRARLIAPQVRNRLKQEALSSRNGGKRTDNQEGKESRVHFKTEQEKRSFPNQGGKTPAGQRTKVLDPKKIDWRKTSDRDLLDMK